MEQKINRRVKSVLLLFFASVIQISLLQAQTGWPIVKDN